MKLTLIEKKQEVRDVTTFVFEPEQPLTWQAGQFLQYTLPHEPADDRGIKRWFTISAAPFEGQVHITTRHSEKGSSFKEALFALPVGSNIEADGLEGDFVIENAEKGGEMPLMPFVFIAGGIGITPFRSMLAELDHAGAAINGTLLYANRDENFVFKAELDAIAERHPSFSIQYLSGDQRIDEEAIRASAPDLSVPLFYVSGPEPMVEVFEKMMLGMGIPDERLKRDYFPGYTWK